MDAPRKRGNQPRWTEAEDAILRANDRSLEARVDRFAATDLLGRTRFRAFTLPDRFVAHGSPAEQAKPGIPADRTVVVGIDHAAVDPGDVL